MLRGAAFLLGIFGLVAALFACLGSKLRECLNENGALPGYSVNVALSLTGILFYAGISWLGTGPAVWIGIATLGFAAYGGVALFLLQRSRSQVRLSPTVAVQ